VRSLADPIPTGTATEGMSRIAFLHRFRIAGAANWRW
jgi:hypothetical protein